MRKDRVHIKSNTQHDTSGRDFYLVCLYFLLVQDLQSLIEFLLRCEVINSEQRDVATYQHDLFTPLYCSGDPYTNSHHSLTPSSSAPLLHC